MKKITFERVGIILFCMVIIGSCAITVKDSFKKIRNATVSSMEKGRKENGIQGMISGGITGFESSLNDNIAFKKGYINLYGLSARILNKHYIIDASGSNSVVKDNRGQLEFITNEIDMQPYVNNIAEMKEVYDEIGARLLYIQTPVKVMENYVKMPTGIEDYSNINSDNLLNKLQGIGVDTLDLRKSVETSGLDKAQLFYKTDHHWRTETAFWAAGAVKDYLNTKYALNLDPENIYTDSKNYKYVDYKKSFLGSQGRRVGKYYGGVDDYTLMLPEYETDYSVTINKNVNQSHIDGDFEKAIVKYQMLNEKDIFTNRYAAYFGADYPEVIIKNNKADNDLKVLIFKDSFGIPFSAFFSTMVGETRMIDTRYFEGDLKEYVKEYKPDVVLYIFKSINTQK